MMKKILPIIIVIVVAFATSYIYFSPILSGKRLSEHDRLTAMGAQKEYNDHLKKTGEASLWSNSMFGGMPTVTFAAKFKGNIAKTIRKIEKFGAYPATALIILILGSYICLILFGVNPWISIAGALLYAFATHNFILVGAGHITKIWALAYLPPLIGSIYYTFTRNRLWGAVFTALFLSLEISSSHPQITYYGLIAVLIFGVVGLIYAYQSKEIKQFFISALYLIIPLGLAVGTNANYLLSTQEYMKFSTRGTNDLTSDLNKGKSGLDKDYILDYSYDVSEAFTAFIPRLKGGSMSEPLGENSNLYKELSKTQGKQQTEKIIQNIPLYWGSQPIVSGPFYFGAITVFLFVLGLFVVKGKEKWWLASVVAISFLLSLGRYFPALSNFAIDYFPLYNKFRDVKNIVFIQCFAMWVLGILSIKTLFQDQLLTEKKQLDSLKFSTIIAGGIALMFALIPSIAGSFTGDIDKQLAGSGWPAQLIDLLRSDRISVARIDSFRSLVFVLLTAGTLWLVIKKKLTAKYAIVIASVLVLADLWPVNKRYLNDDNFVAKRQAENPFTPSKADELILTDKTNYRVLNMSVNPFSDVTTSYFHKSIGGYSGAKLRRYQDMIENHLAVEIQQIGERMKNVKTQSDVDNVFAGLNSLNMLNAKYVIYNPGAAPLANNQAKGNAWFVDGYQLVDNATQELKLISSINPDKVALIDKSFEKQVTAVRLQPDSTSSLTLTSYAPNKLVYRSSSSQNQLAVFSEIYYPKGWIATIDGAKTDYLRANYILRGMVIPSGNHEIVFTFKPESYTTGNRISLFSSILLLLMIGGVVFLEFRKSKTASSNAK